VQPSDERQLTSSISKVIAVNISLKSALGQMERLLKPSCTLQLL